VYTAFLSAVLHSFYIFVMDWSSSSSHLEKGFYAFFYTAPGNFLTTFIYNTHHIFKNYRARGVLWNNQNIIIGGKLNVRNLLRMVCYFFTQSLVVSFSLLTVLMATKAQLNPGIATALWSVSPFFYAFYDQMFFGNKLKINHWIGMTMTVAAAVLISISKPHTQSQSPSTQPPPGTSA
jgi:drug/metabolite transporter (DMT)-like permease